MLFSNLDESVTHIPGLICYLHPRSYTRPEHLILDKEIILSWVNEVLTLSLQTAEEKAERIGADLARLKNSFDPEERQRVGDDLRQLRQIKHRLNVLQVLADCGELPAVRFCVTG